MSWLLDTNVISELSKPRPNPFVLQFIFSCQLDSLFISTICTAELQHGALTAGDANRRAVLESWIETIVRPMFRDRVLEISEAVLIRWIALVEQGRKRKHTYSQPDLFVAATALEHNLTLITRNTRDFTTIPDLKLLNPWEPQP